MTSAAALLSGQTPLAVRMRPVSLDEVAGQKPVSYTHLTLPTSDLV